MPPVYPLCQVGHRSKRVELLLTLPVECGGNVAVVVEPYAAHCREFSPLNGVFDGFFQKHHGPAEMWRAA